VCGFSSSQVVPRPLEYHRMCRAASWSESESNTGSIRADGTVDRRFATAADGPIVVQRVRRSPCSLEYGWCTRHAIQASRQTVLVV
jgi:hypothetical protein